MKKIFLLIAFLFLATWVNAQVNVGFRIGVDAGLFDLKTKGIESYNTTPRYNVIFGMDVDLPFSMNFSFRTGINMVQKASEIDRTQEMPVSDTNWSILYRMTYLEFPLFLVARAETDFGNFYLGAGPTISIGTGGQASITGKSRTGGGQRQYDEKLVWNGKTDNSAEQNFYHFKRLDLGLGASFSYQPPRSGLTFTFTYNKGLRDIAPSIDSELSTSYFGISIGFFMQNI